MPTSSVDAKALAKTANMFVRHFRVFQDAEKFLDGVAQIQANIKALEAEKDQLSTEVQELHAKRSKISKQLSEKEKEYDRKSDGLIQEFHTTKETLQAELDEFRSHCVLETDSIKSQLEKHRAEFEQYTTHMAEKKKRLHDDIDALESALANLKKRVGAA